MDPRRKRLKFRAQHCGMRENDILLGGFAEARIEDLDEHQLSQFEALLEQSDNDVYNWVSGRATPDDAFDTPLLVMIKEYNKTI